MANFRYRFDYFYDQILVPYVGAGLGTSWLRQYRGDRQGYYPYYGYELVAGLQFSLTALDKKASRQLDASTGINHTFLIVEFAKQDRAFNSETMMDLSRNELRFGLRFEI